MGMGEFITQFFHLWSYLNFFLNKNNYGWMDGWRGGKEEGRREEGGIG